MRENGLLGRITHGPCHTDKACSCVVSPHDRFLCSPFTMGVYMTCSCCSRFFVVSFLYE